MKKLTLDVADLRVASFETDKPEAPGAITGTTCLTLTLHQCCA
ncbi:MAG TPA: hypothetical protein VGB15_20875 [Longimicrobium sp.]|jgi:hypothetical protein